VRIVRLRQCRSTAAAAGLWLVLPSAVWAQTPAGAPASRVETPRWEIEASGALSTGRWTSGGRALTPDPGPPIVTSSPVFPSWRVPSWFFGDGAAFLNNVASELALTNRLAPLDQGFLSNSLTDAGGLQAGMRVRRAVAPGYQAEFGLDVGVTRAGFSDDLENLAEATRQSFVSTFIELLGSGPFTSPNVSATATIADGGSREVVLTGALVADSRPVGAFVPYAVAGLGVITQVGESPELVLEGKYRFAINGSMPIDETDRATVRVSRRPTLVAVLGGGLRRDLSRRWGVRMDGRVLIGRTATRLAVDATPGSVTGTPAGFIESFTYPNLQFSNNATTGRVSTLGGTVEDFITSSGGIQTRLRVTVGIFVRY
jgi:hypothetical protein